MPQRNMLVDVVSFNEQVRRNTQWDIAAAGRFLMIKRAGEESQMIVVHGWGRELRERVAGRR